MKKVVKLTKVGYSFAPVFPLLALVFIFSSVSAATGNENFNEYFCHISSTDKKNNEKNNEFINKTSNGHSDVERLIEAKINLEVFVIWITKQYLKHRNIEQ